MITRWLYFPHRRHSVHRASAFARVTHRCKPILQRNGVLVLVTSIAAP